MIFFSPVLSITKILTKVLGGRKKDKVGLMCPEQKKSMPLSNWTVDPRGRSAIDLNSDLLLVMVRLVQA